HLTHAAISTSGTSRVVEGDPVAALGGGPGDRTLLVAHEVAGAALEALLVVEQDPSVGGGHEQVGRARGDAAADRAVDALAIVHRDVGPLVHAELDGAHACLEAHIGVRVDAHRHTLAHLTRRSATRAGPCAPRRAPSRR